MEVRVTMENRSATLGCPCCQGDVALFWANNENNAFVDSHGEILVTAHDHKIRFNVDYCPRCGRKF